MTKQCHTNQALSCVRRNTKLFYSEEKKKSTQKIASIPRIVWACETATNIKINNNNNNNKEINK